MSVSACRASASAATRRIFRTLLPPNAKPIASSRLTSNRGPPPSMVRRRGISSTGVGSGANGTDGNDASAPNTTAMIVELRQRGSRILRTRAGRGHGSRDAGSHGSQGSRDADYADLSKVHRPRHVHLLDSLRSQPSVISAELRPPRAELATAASMDAWIDTYHAVKSLTRGGTFVFLTDSAVGLKEEDNLRHLVNNLGQRRPAFEHRAVSDDETSARVLPGLCRPCVSARVRVAGRARRRQERGATAVRRARLAASSAHPQSSARPDARRLGQSARGCGDAGRVT